MSYNNYFGVEGLEYIPHGEWADPDLVYKGRVFNYWDVFDRLFDEFLEENPEYTDSQAEELFDKYLRENPLKIEELLLDLVEVTPPQFTVDDFSISVHLDNLKGDRIFKGFLNTSSIESKYYTSIEELFNAIDKCLLKNGFTLGDSYSYSYDLYHGTLYCLVYNYKGNFVSEDSVSDVLDDGDYLHEIEFFGKIRTMSDTLIDESDFDLVGINNIQDSE